MAKYEKSFTTVLHAQTSYPLQRSGPPAPESLNFPHPLVCPRPLAGAPARGGGKRGGGEHRGWGILKTLVKGQ